MSMEPDQAHRNLVTALLNAAPDRDRAWKAYINDAEFKAKVHTLVALWGDVVMAMLEAARKQAEMRAQMLELATGLALPPDMVATMSPLPLSPPAIVDPLHPDLWDEASLARARAVWGEDLDRGEFYRDFTPPEPHHVRVWRGLVHKRGIGHDPYLHVDVEHPDSCDYAALNETAKRACPVYRASRQMLTAPNPDTGYFRVDGIHPDGALVLTQLKEPADGTVL